MRVLTVLDLPRDIVARVGDHLSSRERNACRVAHRHFAHIHENRTLHIRTIRTTDDAATLLAACLKLKPRLDTFFVELHSPTAPIDLSRLAPIRQVIVTVIHAGDDGYPIGIRGATVLVYLADHARVNDALVDFLSAQEHIRLKHMCAKHSPLLTSPAVVSKLEVARMHVQPDDAMSPEALRNVTHLDLHVVGLMDLSAWLRVAPALQTVKLHRSMWTTGRGPFSQSLVHLVGELHRARVKLLLDTSNPSVLRFIEEHVSPDMDVAFGWTPLDAPHGYDEYLSARIASTLLKERAIPVDPDMVAPEELRALTEISAMYERFTSDCYRQLWHVAKFM